MVVWGESPSRQEGRGGEREGGEQRSSRLGLLGGWRLAAAATSCALALVAVRVGRASSTDPPSGLCLCLSTNSGSYFTSPTQSTMHTIIAY